MTWAESSSLNPQILFFSPCLQGIVSLFLLHQIYSYLPPWQYFHRSLSWNLNDPWRQLDFIKELMETLGVSSLSYLVFHLVGWEESSQLPGSHMLGRLPALELRLEESQFLSSSVPNKSLKPMGVYKYSHITRSFSLSEQELWEEYRNGLKLQCSLELHISGADPCREGAPEALPSFSTLKPEHF